MSELTRLYDLAIHLSPCRRPVTNFCGGWGNGAARMASLLVVGRIATSPASHPLSVYDVDIGGLCAFVGTFGVWISHAM